MRSLTLTHSAFLSAASAVPGSHNRANASRGAIFFQNAVSNGLFLDLRAAARRDAAVDLH